MSLLTWSIIVTMWASLVGSRADVTLQATAESSAHEAVALGRSRDAALYDAFHAGYLLTPSGDVESAEIITEFRRAVMIVRHHAGLGEYSFNENNLAREMVPYRGKVGFVVQIRLSPLHTYSAPPAYEMYLRTGPTTKPVALSDLKREPVYPPGFFEPGTAFTSFRIEGTVERAELMKAAESMLVVTNDRGDVIWQARIELTRFR